LEIIDSKSYYKMSIETIGFPVGLTDSPFFPFSLYYN
jgi:hypothetical protein